MKHLGSIEPTAEQRQKLDTPLKRIVFVAEEFAKRSVLPDAGEIVAWVMDGTEEQQLRQWTALISLVVNELVNVPEFAQMFDDFLGKALKAQRVDQLEAAIKAGKAVVKKEQES